MALNDLHIFIVAENPLARAGLTALLENQPGLQIVGQTAPDADLSATATVYQADVLVWDLGWDMLRALELLAEQHEHLPPIVVLLAEAGGASDALAAGARGLLLQDSAPDALGAAAQAVAAGLVVVVPEALPLALPGASGEALLPPDTLTPRELQVLALMAEGLANKIIAARLGISDHTVKFHVNAVMSKLGAQSRTEAVVRATRLGLIVL